LYSVDVSINIAVDQVLLAKMTIAEVSGLLVSLNARDDAELQGQVLKYIVEHKVEFIRSGALSSLSKWPDALMIVARALAD
jgi:hypothetical protein